jgi:hypothetical protein
MKERLKLQIEDRGAIQFYLLQLFKVDPIAYKLLKKCLDKEKVERMEIEYKVLDSEVIRKIKIKDEIDLIIW